MYKQKVIKIAMNILVCSEAAWDDKNSFGNTVSNFFCGNVWSRDHFCNFYARKALPDNKATVSYYNLSAVDIVKGLMKFHVEGRSFATADAQTIATGEAVSAHQKEQGRIDRIHQGNNDLIYWGHEQIWRSRIWLNTNFKQFIAENKPDVLFAFATSSYILLPIIQYLKKETQCKIVLLIADDVYGDYDQKKFYRKWYLKREFEKCIQAADKLYGISNEMSAMYSKRFGKPVETLYKGCDLSVEPKKYLNHPLRLVYAGNLLWGRDDTLAQVADALERINQDGLKATLEIYTGTTVTDTLKKKLNKGSSSHSVGSRPYEEIKEVMHEADVVLHVESFEEKEIDTVRYSFSTKIIDCLQSGSQVLGIGPGGIASINYLKKVDGVVVVESKTRISETISKIVNQGKLLANAKQTRRYALQKHDLNAVQKRLREEFEIITSIGCRE